MSRAERDASRWGKRRLRTPGKDASLAFPLSSPRDLPGLKELRAAGLLDNRPPPGAGLGDEEDEDREDEDQVDMFEED